MIYETVYIGEFKALNGLKNSLTTSKEKQCILQIDTSEDWTVVKSGNVVRIEGTLLELRSQKDTFELTIAGKNGEVIFIHSKNVVLTSYTILSEDKVISLYEVLWAAGVKLNPVTLSPAISDSNETSLSQLYYVDLKAAG